MRELKLINHNIRLISMIFLTIFIGIICISDIKAVNIISYVEAIGGEKSYTCGTGRCATNIAGFSGFKISIINKNGEVIGTKNFWSSSNVATKINNGAVDSEDLKYKGVSCIVNPNYNSIKYTNSSNIYVAGAKLPYIDEETENLWRHYSNYFSNLGESQVLAIIKGIMGESVNVNDYLSYYLKFEPIYVVKELYTTNGTAYCGFFVGTSREIIDKFGSDKNNNSNYSIGRLFIHPYKYKDLDLGWNTVRNYIVSMYYSCDSKNLSGNDLKVACYSGTTAKLSSYKSPDFKGLYDLYKNNPSSIGVGYVKVEDYLPHTYTLTINKKDGSTPQSRVQFRIVGNGIDKWCSSSGYNGTNIKGTCSVSGLTAGKYIVTETVPRGYDASKITCDGCSSVNKSVLEVFISNNKTITVNNRKTCQSEFDALPNKSDKAARVALYQKYGWTNLLDFTNTTNASLACRAANCTTNNITMGCLSAKDNSGFNANNLSCYKETITVGNQTGYCGVTFSLNNTISGFNNTYSFGNNFKAGQMVLNRDYPNSIIAIGTLSKNCYVYGSGIGNTVSGESKQSYSSYIGDLYLDDQKLSNTSENNSGWVIANVSGGVSFTKTLSTLYRLKPVYADLGTGKLSYEKCSSETNRCRLLGYGFASKLDTKANQVINVPYSISINIPKTTVGTTSGKCSYIISDNRMTTIPNNPGELNIEFRPIETDNAFPGKNAEGRIVGDNWRSKNFDLDGNGLVNQNDVVRLRNEISKGSRDLKYDINKDGKVDNKDVELLNFAITNKVSAGENKMSTNVFIKYIMETTNNSYDKNKTGPIYRITLNSDTINKIRDYNETSNYDDYTLECKEDGYNCKSTFLEKFGIKRLK